MEKIITLLENNETKEALEILNGDISLFSKKTEDGWSLLQLAAYYNNAEIIQYCLSNMSYELINQDKVHPLIIAIEERNEDALKAFINFSDESKINWKIKEKSGDNLVYLAVYYELNNLVEDLIKKGISCFDKNNQDINAFTLIVEKGNVELFDKIEEHNLVENYNEILIKKSIQKDCVSIFERLQPYSRLDSDDLFKLAAGFDSIKIISNIMESGEIIPGMEQVTKIVDLMCKKYDKEEDKKAAKSLANYLFDVKIPFNQFVNDKGQSAWMLCIQNDNEEIFERLMSSSENVNVTDTEHHSPLFYAIEKNNDHFVHLLLRKKANPNQLDKQKNTPLIKAVEKGNAKMVEEILKYCQMINEPNSNNEHALSISIKKRRMDIVTQLIWAGGEITTNPVKFIEEKQMFHFGATGETERFSYHEEEQIDNFVALSKLGFRLDQTNQDGDTFLLHFIKNGYISNFSAILKCQFNPNQFDINGNSAIMCSAMKRQDEYFNAILNRFRNVDLEQKNSDGDNVYDLCIKSGKIHRVEKLLDYDENLSIDNASKAAKILAKDGKLDLYANKLIKSGLDLSFSDDNKSNLLMFSLVGGNLHNFKYLIEVVGVPVNLKETNKNGNSIENIIEAMPEEIGNEFSIYLKKKLGKKP